jgi:hypothetical protein
MEDDLMILENGRRPQDFGKWQTTSILWKIGDDINSLIKGRQPQNFGSGRHLQFL